MTVTGRVKPSIFVGITWQVNGPTGFVRRELGALPCRIDPRDCGALNGY
jgi:hypothetical protein